MKRLIGLALIWSIAGCGGGGNGKPIDASVDAPIVEPDATVGTPDATVGTPDATVGTPDATVETPDATVRDPDASLGEPDAGDSDAGPPAASQPAILGFTDPQIDNFADDLTGFRFTVGADAITVTDLGMYDDGQDGLGEAHDVGIYDVATQTLVVSATIPAADAAPLDGTFRYVSVAPVVLAANTTYVVLMYRPTAVDGIAFFVMSLMVSPFITYESDVAQNATGGLVFSNMAFGIPNAWFGPNFKAHP